MVQGKAPPGLSKPNPFSGWGLVKRNPEGKGGARGKTGSGAMAMGMDSRMALLVAGSGGFLLGLALGRCWDWLGRLRNYQPVASEKTAKPAGGGRAGPSGLPIEQMSGQHDEYKMVLVVRNDLKMGKGKIGAQCGHAAIGLYQRVVHRAPRSIERWEECGQVKVVVRVDSENELLKIQEKAKSEGIPTHITVDAGRTQIAANSRTVMAILGPEEVVQRVTGHLKLL